MGHFPNEQRLGYKLGACADTLFISLVLSRWTGRTRWEACNWTAELANSGVVCLFRHDSDMVTSMHSLTQRYNDLDFLFSIHLNETIDGENVILHILR